MALGLLSTLDEDERLQAMLDIGWDLSMLARERLLRTLLDTSSFASAPEFALNLRATLAALRSPPPDEVAHAVARFDPQALLRVVRLFLAEASSDDCFELCEGMRRKALGSQSSVDHVLQVYTTLGRAMSEAGVDLKGRRLLELGPGHSLLGGLLLLSWGLGEYHGVDAFPVARWDADRVRALRTRLGSACGLPLHEAPLAQRKGEVLARFDRAVTIKDGEAVLNEDMIQLHCPVDAADLPLESNSYDLVVSNSVLEHVKDLPATAAECARVLAPGGVAFHQVDFRDHRDFSQPRAFLRVPNREWEELWTDRPFQYTNRHRLSAVREAFSAAGLELLELKINERLPLGEEERRLLHPSFQACSQEDLEVLGASLLLRKGSV